MESVIISVYNTIKKKKKNPLHTFHCDSSSFAFSKFFKINQTHTYVRTYKKYIKYNN